MHIRAYLSSTKIGETDPLCNWKEQFMAKVNAMECFIGDNDVSMTFIDPFMFYAPKNTAVVEADINNLDICNVIICCISTVTIGTMMELAYSAFMYPDRQKRIIISTNPTVLNHPWMKNLTREKPYGSLGKATLCNTIDEAVMALARFVTQAKEEQNK